MTRYLRLLAFLALGAMCAFAQQSSAKSKISFDEFFNAVSISDVDMAPDGHAVVIETNRADWENSFHRHDLWLYRMAEPAGAPGKGKAAAPTAVAGSLVQLTQSGHDSDAAWSPDSKWIAFISDRRRADLGAGKDGDAGDDDGPKAQIWLIPADGGEALPITSGDEEVHAFTWSGDGKSIYFATRTPWNKKQKDEYKKQWKDVVQWRASERGDVIVRLDVAEAMQTRAVAGSKMPSDDETAETAGAHVMSSTPYTIDEITSSQDGKWVAFISSPVSRRLENVADYEIYTLDTAIAEGQKPRQLTKNNAEEHEIHFSSDSKRIYFTESEGSVDGPYAEVQPRLYSVDLANGTTQREAADFQGAIGNYAAAPNGDVIFTGQIGTETQLYVQPKAGGIHKLNGWPGFYGRLSQAKTGRLAFYFSAQDRPEEIFVANDPAQPASASPISDFNHTLAARDLPRGKPYRWKSDDGTDVEGWLVYPPGKFEAKGLKTLVFIHGGPVDGDGNRFGANWYDWATLAATHGWLVLRPNYRGSSGYGDKFLQEIMPKLVSIPGKDILTGVDALVKDGIADPDRLAIGGYSYGGYMTNWLITQTTRFKAAVTGAGAVEHAANWGYDDLTADDAWYLGGRPWENAKVYQDEAALFQMNKVTTPTHMVAGDADVRVSFFEGVAMERAFQSLGIPHALLLFPGEGHGLRKNPWHGRIKVREEMQWLDRYVPPKAGE